MVNAELAWEMPIALIYLSELNDKIIKKKSARATGRHPAGTVATRLPYRVLVRYLPIALIILSVKKLL